MGRSVRAFYTRLFERLRRLPGVRAAGAVLELPLSDMRNMGTFEIEGARRRAAATSHTPTGGRHPPVLHAMGITRWSPDESSKCVTGRRTARRNSR